MFWFSEAMLYVPHIDEEDLVAQINEAKLNQETWEKFTHEIIFVDLDLKFVLSYF